MKNTLNNPMRYKTISEMADWEIWYISEDSLCFDIQEQTGETIYALFHYHPYSKEPNNLNKKWEIYDIKIQCNIVDNKIFFQIFNPIYKINFEDLSKISPRIFTILNIKSEDISILNINRESLDTDMLEEEFNDFIEQILDNLEDEDDNDEAYGKARTNFSYVMTDYCHKDNWHNIENILFNLYHIINNNIIDKDKLLEIFSDYIELKNYLISLEKEQTLTWYVEQEIQQKIESISWIFYDIFDSELDNELIDNIWKETQEVVDKNNPSIEDLNEQLAQALKNENYEKASEIRDEIRKLWWTPKQ